MILAFDTATRYCSVALQREKEIDSRVENSPQGHARRLLPMVEELLKDVQGTPADLKGVVVGLGPGSFTGLRIGIATALGLQSALGIPCYGVSSLEARALFPGEGLRIPLIDARRNRVYSCVRGDAFFEESNLPFEELLDWLETKPGQLLFSGEEIDVFLQQAKVRLGSRVEEVFFRDYARGLLQSFSSGLFTEDLSPRYLRETQAEAQKRGVTLD